MIQPAGYIRIMAEELVKNNRSVFGKVVTGVEHVAVGLPFVHLLQPPPGNPDERIEPKETADQLDGDAFRRMAVTDMTRFMAENDHAPATFVSSAQENRAQELTGKAMIVALTRSIAIKIYRKMLELRPQWTEKVKVVMSGSNQDPEDWQPIIGNEAYKKELARKFKDNDDEMKIAIVRDMWLTGFDVPSLATMYVYKPMSGHNLMQAIARVNRVFPGKEGGLIVDYVGIAQALKSAMQQYTNRDRRRFGDPDIAKTARLKWKEEMEICRDQLHGFDYSGFFEQDNSKRALAITSGANFLSSPAMIQRKKNFMEHSNLLHNATTLCRSLLNEQQKAEVCYMDALRVMMLKLSQKGKISRHEINERIGDLLRQSVKTDGVINLFGDRQIEFSLFDDAFIQEVKNMKERNLAVELLTKLMKEKIKQQQKSLDVQSDLSSQITFYCIMLVHYVTDSAYFFVSQISYASIRINLCICKDFVSAYSTDTVDVSQTNFDTFFSW